MKFRHLSFLLLMYFPAIAFAQTSIEGKVENATAKNIILSRYADMISWMEETVTTAAINEDGSYTLNFNPENTAYYNISIDFQKAELYLQPGKNYQINFVYDTETPQISFTNPVALNYELIQPKEELNESIQRVNAIYNDFILENFDAIYKRRQKHLIDSLEKYIDKAIAEHHNEYLNNYVKYKIASIEQFARIKSKQKIAEDYLINSEVLYNNIEYMDFFNQFFDKYFASGSREFSWGDISDVIKKGDFHSFMSLVKTDSLLMKNPRIMEMVTLKELQNVYYLPGIKKEHVVKFIEAASVNFNYTENREIAKNILHKLTYLTAGTKVPRFELPDFTGEMVKLKDVNDKPTYINFWNLSCRPCIDELDSIAEYNGQLNNRIRFISISTDTRPEQARQFLQSKNYDWIFLQFNDNYQLLKDYQVQTYPYNILIDKDGNVLKYPARLPGESLRNVLRNFTFTND